MKKLYVEASEMPKNCIECPFIDGLGSSKVFCKVTNALLHDDKVSDERHQTCPLRAIEQKREESKEIIKTDVLGRVIYHRDIDGYEVWQSFDWQGYRTYFCDSIGDEWWRKFDESGNEIYFRDNKGNEHQYEYDNGELVYKREEWTKPKKNGG